MAEGKGRVLVIAQQAGTQGDGLPVEGDAFGEMPAFLLDAAEIVQACAQFRRNGVFRLPYFSGAAQAPATRPCPSPQEAMRPSSA